MRCITLLIKSQVSKPYLSAVLCLTCYLGHTDESGEESDNDDEKRSNNNDGEDDAIDEEEEGHDSPVCIT
jgi:hypothetical protein